METIVGFLYTYGLMALIIFPALFALFSRQIKGVEKVAWVAFLVLTSWLGFIGFIVYQKYFVRPTPSTS